MRQLISGNRYTASAVGSAGVPVSPLPQKKCRTPKLAALVFLVILFLPPALTAASRLLYRKLDVELKGYVDQTDRPALTLQGFLDRSFQDGFSEWFESYFKPVGVLRKTHATVRYGLFNLGNRPIGKNRDIFETHYIDEQLCINGYDDMSRPEKRETLETYVERLQDLRLKLRAVGKELYFVLAPSKANFDRGNIPQKYLAVADPCAVNTETFFSQLLENSGIPHLLSTEMKDELTYPPFYSTGIHWSRTYEQLASARVIKDLSELTGRRYRNILLGEAETSRTAFWRDRDVYDLLNVWTEPDETYYQYAELREPSDHYDRLRAVIQGDSFARGFPRDVKTVYPYEDIYLIVRNHELQKPKGGTQQFESWESFPFQELLDSVDVVILESTAHELRSCSFGFVEHLSDALESYVPGEHVTRYCAGLEPDTADPLFKTSQQGFYGPEDGHFWTKALCELRMTEPRIGTDGLEVRFGVPEHLFPSDSPVCVELFVNGERLYSREFTQAWSGTVVLDCTGLAVVDDTYCLEICTSASFDPKAVGLSNKSREYSLEVFYIGSGEP